jgi:bacterioferritin
MARTNTSATLQSATSREDLISLLNEDLGREYQAILSYVVYSQVLKGPEDVNIASELEKHAQHELSHALILAKQIDDLGRMPAIRPIQVRTSEKVKVMQRFDLDNETETIRNYPERASECDALGEFAIAQHILEILMQDEEHPIDLATALGIAVPTTKSNS